jgi:hypothetical protein
MSAFPFLFLKGFNQKDDLVLSEEMAIVTENVQADAKYLEFTGAAIAALRESEKDIITEIFDIAMKQVRPKGNSQQTAEAKKLDRIDSLSDIQARALNFSNSEQMCWEYAAKWLKLEYTKDEDLKVNYNLDFDLQQIKADLLRTLLDMRTIKDISRDTMWKIMKQGEILPKNFDPEEETEKIVQEEREAYEFQSTLTVEDEEEPEEIEYIDEEEETE